MLNKKKFSPAMGYWVDRYRGIQREGEGMGCNGDTCPTTDLYVDFQKLKQRKQKKGKKLDGLVKK